MKPTVFLKSDGAWVKEIVSVCHSHGSIIYKKVGRNQTITNYLLVVKHCYVFYIKFSRFLKSIRYLSPKNYNVGEV